MEWKGVLPSFLLPIYCLFPRRFFRFKRGFLFLLGERKERRTESSKLGIPSAPSSLAFLSLSLSFAASDRF